jgi:hypothetical protein
MEIILNDDNIGHKAFSLNNTLKSTTNKYELLFNSVKINNKTKFIASVYRLENLILRFEYIIMGSYHKTKNVWIWADMSDTLDKNLKTYIRHQRDNLRNNLNNDPKLLYEKHFIDNDYYVLPTTKLINCIFHIGVKLFTDKKNQIVTFSRNDDIIDFYISNQILFEIIF